MSVIGLPKLPLPPEERKVLHVDAREGGDWGQDLLHAGLVKYLGPARVIDFPYHFKHREQVPLAFDGNPEHDWGLERRTLGYTPENHRVSFYSDEEIRDELRQGNIRMIFIDERDESYELYLRLRANFFDVPVVVVAGHDRFWNKSPEFVANRYGKNLEMMFLDNWRPEYGELGKKGIKACIYSWSINFDHYWTPNRNQEKIYDISFMGYNSHPDRARIVDHILSKWGHLKLKLDLERTPDTMRSYVRKSDYFDVMARSKVCLNLRGAAENGKTLRFYEIPYVGSCMLTQDSGADHPYEFTPGHKAVYFKDLKELDEKITWLFEKTNNPRWVDIARNGHDWAMAFHTVEARIKYMFAVINGNRLIGRDPERGQIDGQI